VKVHILIDWVGSQKMDEALLKEMKDAGAEIFKYHPPRWYNINRLNNRTHRKLLVTDGHVGFTGGVGIADEWSGHAAGQGPLARHALPRRGTGGRPDAGGVRGQLAQGKRRGVARRGVLPGDQARGRALRADVHELPGGRRREHAPHVPAVHRRRAPDDRPLDGVLRPRRARERRAHRGDSARK
jgi:hypothetical protein